MSNHVTHLSDETFDNEVLASDIPVLVDFWAEWCSPCKALDPALHEVADLYAGKVKVAKLNVDDHQALAVRYRVRGIPLLILFKGGQIADTLVGLQTKASLQAFIDRSA